MGTAQKEKMTAQRRKKGVMSSRRCHLKKRMLGGWKRTEGCGFVSGYEGRFVSSEGSCATTRATSSSEMSELRRAATDQKKQRVLLHLDQEKIKEYPQMQHLWAQTQKHSKHHGPQMGYEAGKDGICHRSPRQQAQTRVQLLN